MATGESLDLASIAKRLQTVEHDVADLKQRVGQADDQPWYLKHAGIFADDPDFEEIVRLGRKIRQADRPD